MSPAPADTLAPRVLAGLNRFKLLNALKVDKVELVCRVCEGRKLGVNVGKSKVMR